jgi:hypothetical protein
MGVPQQVVSAGTIEVNFAGGRAAGLKDVVFVELGAVSMKRAAVDMLVSTARGGFHRIQQPGQIGVVTVNLKIPLDESSVSKVITWYNVWNKGDAKLGKADVTVRVKDAAGGLCYGYVLQGAAPTDCKIDGMKPGGGTVGNIDLTLTCDEILPLTK